MHTAQRAEVEETHCARVDSLPPSLPKSEPCEIEMAVAWRSRSRSCSWQRVADRNLWGSTPTSPPATYESLSQRPVALPVVSPGTQCPVSRPVDSPKIPKGSFVPNGFGQGPVYLTGEFDVAWYSGESAQLIVDPAYSDIVLIRGKQLNGPQGMPLVATPPSPSPSIELPAGHSSDGRQ